jgi:ABC-2 type transport system ATP-binding protein
VLFLDEPTTGLDPRSRIQMWQVIESLVADGTTVLLTTQYLEEADELCDRITVIDQGRVIAEGTPAELKARSAQAVLTLQVADAAELSKATEVLSRLGDDRPSVDEEERRISVAARGGAMMLAQAVRDLDAAGVRIADIALRQPTLDDVFLALTGHHAEKVATPDNEVTAPRGRRPGRSRQ